MDFKAENEYGIIVINENAVYQIIRDCIVKYKDKVWLATVKDKGVVDSLSLSYIVDPSVQKLIFEDNGKYNVKFNMLLKFGESINTLRVTLLKDIYTALTKEIGIPVENVTVNITGMFTKNNNIVKRDITVSLNEINR